MTISIKHKFTSAKSDPPDATIVRPSNWNDDHKLTMASGRVLGRLTDGDGDAEELTLERIVTWVRESLGATTGDVKWAYRTGELDGWVRLNGRTIGPSGSAATERANDDTEALYKLIWNNFSNTLNPVTGGRGGSADTDWAAGKPIALPDARDRGIIGVSNMGATAASRIAASYFAAGGATTAGSSGGVDGVALAANQMPQHNHSVSLTTSSAGAHSHKYGEAVLGGGPAGSGVRNKGVNEVSTSTDGAHTHTVSGNTGDAGSGAEHNNMPPFISMTGYIKL